MTVRFGYSFWGFLGDNKIEGGKEVSTPDGNATYSWSIISEAGRRGWRVFQMQKNRDAEAIARHSIENFSAFSQVNRYSAYCYAEDTMGIELPELDVLLIEWRWPIDGRNCSVLPDGGILLPSFRDRQLQPDLARQFQLLNHYKEKGTKIILWDLDHKLEEKDELWWSPDAIFETSVVPRHLSMKRTSVEFPTVVKDLLEYPTLPHNREKALVYIGSRYERDDVIEQYIKPVSEAMPGMIHFYGNWTNEPHYSQVREMWPKIQYHGRITTKDFREAYGDAMACPLLAKRSYFETGFTTPRVYEALGFGTLPIGFDEHNGIDRYVMPGLIARDSVDLADILFELHKCNVDERDALRRKNIEMIEFMDARYFIDKVQRVLEK